MTSAPNANKTKAHYKKRKRISLRCITSLKGVAGAGGDRKKEGRYLVPRTKAGMQLPTNTSGAELHYD